MAPQAVTKPSRKIGSVCKIDKLQEINDVHIPQIEPETENVVLSLTSIAAALQIRRVHNSRCCLLTTGSIFSVRASRGFRPGVMGSNKENNYVKDTVLFFIGGLMVRFSLVEV